MQIYFIVYYTNLKQQNHLFLVCLNGYKMLSNGSCYEYKRSAVYVMKEKNTGIISDDVISTQVHNMSRITERYRDILMIY